MTSRYREERLGACTDCRRYWAQYRAGQIERAEIERIETRLATTAGTCPVMGTASTMACIAETLGMMLPGTAAIPAVHADRLRAAEASGAHAVTMARQGPRPREVVTQAAVGNALRVLLAVGGSTNGILHLAAIAGRAGVALPLDALNPISDATPVLVDLKPTGPHYMEDFFAAGGLGAVLRELQPLLDLDVPTVTGETLAARLEGDAWVDRDVIRPFADPRQPQGGLVALFGSLAPGGAILKTLGGGCDAVRARGPRGGVREPRGAVGTHRRSGSRRHAGRRAGAAERRAEERFRHAGSGLPADPRQAREAGRQGHDPDLGRAHERHSFRHVVLHVTPEAAVGGALGLVQSGDRIRLSVADRRLDLLVEDHELARRAATWQAAPAPARGYARLYHDHVMAADRGCDFDFLTATV